MFPTEQAIRTHYRYQISTRNLRAKLDKQVIEQLRSKGNSNLNVSIPRIKPLWLCMLSDALNSQSLDSYVQYSDYQSNFNDLTQIISSKLPLLTQNQAYVISAKGGIINLQIETTIRDDHNPESKAIRTLKVVDGVTIQIAVQTYVRKCMTMFLPCMVTNFLQCVKFNKVDVQSIELGDIRFSDYLLYNVEGNVGLNKKDFLQSAQPLDFYHAINYHPNPALNPFNIAALYTLYLTAPHIGQHLYKNGGIMLDTDFVGSSAISVNAGKIEKKTFVSKQDAFTLLKLPISRIVDSADDLTDSIFTDSFGLNYVSKSEDKKYFHTPTSEHKTPIHKPELSDEEVDPENM